MSSTTSPGHVPLTPPVLHVLLALADAPLHGYAIMQRVEAESGIVMGPGTIYGSLQRMERDGLVTELPPAGGQDSRRRCYGITPAGRAALAAETTRLERLAVLARSRLAGEGGAA